jgi:hypothetical protein
MIASGQPVELFDLVEVISGDRCSQVVAMVAIVRQLASTNKAMCPGSGIARSGDGIRKRIRK